MNFSHFTYLFFRKRSAIHDFCLFCVLFVWFWVVVTGFGWFWMVVVGFSWFWLVLDSCGQF